MSEDERGDPFEDLDAPEDREGDPFERLDSSDADPPADGAPVEEPPDDADIAGEPSAGAGPTDDPPTDSTDSGGFEEEFIDRDDPFTEDAPNAGDTTDPFSGMDDREGDPFGGGESAFEAVDVEGLDAEEVWATLDADDDRPSGTGKRYVDVSKHRFCEQCEHFAEPPAAHCTHGEAEIIEHLDMETVRLLNCPIVAQQRELENEG